MNLSKKHIAILSHTSKNHQKLYCGSSKEMYELCLLGLMKSAGKKSFVPDGYFKITKAGESAWAKSLVAKAGLASAG